MTSPHNLRADGEFLARPPNCQQLGQLARLVGRRPNLRLKFPTNIGGYPRDGRMEPQDLTATFLVFSSSVLIAATLWQLVQLNPA